MTDYGPIFEVWFDGANGGDGYYGGARTTRKIDPRTYYDWENTWKIVRELQPDACMFSDVGPDVRWVGNESGVAGDPCWATFSPERYAIGGTPGAALNRGDRAGTHWLPAEVDVSIRPGWFYHPAEDSSVMSAARLIKLYFESVGRGCNLILNVPPDRRGRIHENDARALPGGERNSTPSSRTTWRGGRTCRPAALEAMIIVLRLQTWPTATLKPTGPATTQSRTPELVLDLPHPATLSAIRLREYLPLGQRVERFAVDSWNGKGWDELASATSIGNQRILPIRPTTTTKVRLRIIQSPVCPAISELSLFSSPAP